VRGPRGDGELAPLERRDCRDPSLVRSRCRMTWWRRLWRRGRMDDLLERELRFHLDQHAADLVTGGVSPDEARRQARLALGGPEPVEERCRDERKARRLDELLPDVRSAVRALRRRPGPGVV